MLLSLATVCVLVLGLEDAVAPVAVERVVVRETVAPDLAAADRLRLESRMLAALEARAIATARGPASADARACATQLCRSRTGAKHGISHSVRAEIDRADRNYHLRVSVVRMSDGVALAQGEAECLICGIDDVAAVLADHTAGIVAGVVQPRPSPPPPVLPPPGTHDRPRSRAGPALRPVGIGLVLAGSAAVVGGAVLLGVDGEAIRRRCGAEARDADGDCRYVHATLGGGIALVSSGVLAIAGGITLVTIARRRHRTALRARVGLGRIVLTGRF